MDPINLAGNGSASATAGDLIQDAETQDFATAVVQASMEQTVLVDFWAPWCGPCKQLTPALEKVVTQAGGAVKLVKINVDNNQQLAQQLRVQSIPTVMAFRNGQPVDGFMGALPESQLKEFIEKVSGGAIAPSPIEQLLSHAKAAEEAGDMMVAGQVYSQILQAEPDNVAAIAGLAKALITQGELEQAEQILSTAPDGTTDNDLESARAALDLARQSEEAGDIAPLQAALQANPKDHQARFDLAIALNASGDRDGAVEHLLTIVEMDRAWNEEEARKQLLTFFEAYGPTDPLTVSARRRLSSILFS